MVSILPPKRNMWSGISEAMSEFGKNAPQLLEERYQNERGLKAIDDLQKQLGESGGDINKMLPALAKAYSQNPSLERSGLGQQFLQQSQRQQGTGEYC